MAGEKSILIDPTRCVGCHACYTACKNWNGLPDKKPQTTGMDTVASIRPENWNYVQHATAGDRRVYFPMMCLHCTDAPCVMACPENAIVDVNGWKVVKREYCIGCGSCVDACPYHAVQLYEGPNRGSLQNKKAYKCDGCTENFSDVPRCVRNCPTGALTFDYRLRILSLAARIQERVRKAFTGARVYGPDVHRGTNVLLILLSGDHKGLITDARQG
ncbi:MAG: 4Fe-4S dicluster domain-containing protein, partial [Spirochaetota bacterium]